MVAKKATPSDNSSPQTEDASHMRSQPQQERSRKKLRQILDAADLELGENGLERTQMTAIAKRAGIAAATMYRFFPDKEALMEGLALDYQDDAVAAFAGLIADLEGSEELSEVASQLLRSSFELQRQHPGFFALAIEAWDNPDAPSAAARNALIDIIIDWVPGRGFLDDEPERRRPVLRYVIETVRHSLFIGPAPDMTMEQHLREIEAMIVGYIKALEAN